MPLHDRWLLLVPQLPTRPDYARVKLWRRMRQLGAVSLRGGVYVLPAREPPLADLTALRAEAESLGGALTAWRAAIAHGITDDVLIQRFREQSDRDYAIITAAAHAGRSGATTLRRRLADAAARDYFAAAGHDHAEAAVNALEQRSATSTGSPRPAPRGATWVTRADVFIDRIASAWLIRRFIDPRAKFRFDRPERPQRHGDELRFDTFDGEYTHRGDRCTFEVLLDEFALRDDPALAALGEIVHDIDLKDDKFGRVESEGIAAVLRGLVAANASDPARIKAGAQLFDSLYAQFGAMTK
jgi:hypothetical protein